MEDKSKVYGLMINPDIKFFKNESKENLANTQEELRKMAKNIMTKSLLIEKSRDVITEEELDDIKSKLLLFSTLDETKKTVTSIDEQSEVRRDNLDHDFDILYSRYSNFKQYQSFKASLSEKIQKKFPLELFSKLYQYDKLGRVETELIYKYIEKKNFINQCRITLAYYDENMTGYIKEVDMQRYTHDLITGIPGFSKNIPKTGITTYVNTCNTIINFLIDQYNSGQIKIIDLITSGNIEKLYSISSGVEGRLLPFIYDNSKHNTLDILVENQMNWFKYPFTKHIASKFMLLDVNKTGRLDINCLDQYKDIGHTRIFFEQYLHTYGERGQEIDYEEFIRLIIASINLKNPLCLRYIFNVLDTNKDGMVDLGDLFTFYKEAKEIMVLDSGVSVNFEIYVYELMDIICPKSTESFTFKELLECGKADYIIRNLTGIMEI